MYQYTVAQAVRFSTLYAMFDSIKAPRVKKRPAFSEDRCWCCICKISADVTVLKTVEPTFGIALNAPARVERDRAKSIAIRGKRQKGQFCCVLSERPWIGLCTTLI